MNVRCVYFISLRFKMCPDDKYIIFKNLSGMKVFQIIPNKLIFLYIDQDNILYTRPRTVAQTSKVIL